MKQLWDIIYQMGNNMIHLWLVGEDFNKLNEEEKIGGDTILPQYIEEFSLCISSSKLYEVGLKDVHLPEDCIFARLNRVVLINN